MEGFAAAITTAIVATAAVTGVFVQHARHLASGETDITYASGAESGATKPGAESGATKHKGGAKRKKMFRRGIANGSRRAPSPSETSSVERASGDRQEQGSRSAMMHNTRDRIGSTGARAHTTHDENAAHTHNSAGKRTPSRVCGGTRVLGDVRGGTVNHRATGDTAAVAAANHGTVFHPSMHLSPLLDQPAVPRGAVRRARATTNVRLSNGQYGVTKTHGPPPGSPRTPAHTVSAPPRTTHTTNHVGTDDYEMLAQLPPHLRRYVDVNAALSMEERDRAEAHARDEEHRKHLQSQPVKPWYDSRRTDDSCRTVGERQNPGSVSWADERHPPNERYEYIDQPRVKLTRTFGNDGRRLPVEGNTVHHPTGRQARSYPLNGRDADNHLRRMTGHDPHRKARAAVLNPTLMPEVPEHLVPEGGTFMSDRERDMQSALNPDTIGDYMLPFVRPDIHQWQEKPVSYKKPTPKMRAPIIPPSRAGQYYMGNAIGERRTYDDALPHATQPDQAASGTLRPADHHQLGDTRMRLPARATGGTVNDAVKAVVGRPERRREPTVDEEIPVPRGMEPEQYAAVRTVHRKLQQPESLAYGSAYAAQGTEDDAGTDVIPGALNVSLHEDRRAHRQRAENTTDALPHGAAVYAGGDDGEGADNVVTAVAADVRHRLHAAEGGGVASESRVRNALLNNRHAVQLDAGAHADAEGVLDAPHNAAPVRVSAVRGGSADVRHAQREQHAVDAAERARSAPRIADAMDDGTGVGVGDGAYLTHGWSRDANADTREERTRAREAYVAAPGGAHGVVADGAEYDTVDGGSLGHAVRRRGAQERGERVEQHSAVNVRRDAHDLDEALFVDAIGGGGVVGRETRAEQRAERVVERERRALHEHHAHTVDDPLLADTVDAFLASLPRGGDQAVRRDEAAQRRALTQTHAYAERARRRTVDDDCLVEGGPSAMAERITAGTNAHYVEHGEHRAQLRALAQAHAYAERARRRMVDDERLAEGGPSAMVERMTAGTNAHYVERGENVARRTERAMTGPRLAAVRADDAVLAEIGDAGDRSRVATVAHTSDAVRAREQRVVHDHDAARQRRGVHVSATIDAGDGNEGALDGGAPPMMSTSVHEDGRDQRARRKEHYIVQRRAHRADGVVRDDGTEDRHSYAVSASDVRKNAGALGDRRLRAPLGAGRGALHVGTLDDDGYGAGMADRHETAVGTSTGTLRERERHTAAAREHTRIVAVPRAHADGLSDAGAEADAYAERIGTTEHRPDRTWREPLLHARIDNPDSDVLSAAVFGGCASGGVREQHTERLDRRERAPLESARRDLDDLHTHMVSMRMDPGTVVTGATTSMANVRAEQREGALRHRMRAETPPPLHMVEHNARFRALGAHRQRTPPGSPRRSASPVFMAQRVMPV